MLSWRRRAREATVAFSGVGDVPPSPEALDLLILPTLEKI
jgi:hypothetical protein